MSKTPPTFGTDPALHSGISWTDSATLHRKDDGGGVLYELKVVRRGSLASLVRHFMRLPAGDRRQYVIEIPGDHRLDYAEVEALAAHPDFPKEED